jgi:hypothetical protein
MANIFDWLAHQAQPVVDWWLGTARPYLQGPTVIYHPTATHPGIPMGQYVADQMLTNQQRMGNLPAWMRNPRLPWGDASAWVEAPGYKYNYTIGWKTIYHYGLEGIATPYSWQQSPATAWTTQFGAQQQQPVIAPPKAQTPAATDYQYQTTYGGQQQSYPQQGGQAPWTQAFNQQTGQWETPAVSQAPAGYAPPRYAGYTQAAPVGYAGPAGYRPPAYANPYAGHVPEALKRGPIWEKEHNRFVQERRRSKESQYGRRT